MSSTENKRLATARAAVRWLHNIEDGVIVLVLVAMVLLAVLQIIMRNFFDSSFLWIEPFLQNAVLWIGLLGAMIASRRDEHIRIDLAAQLVSPVVRRYIHVLVDLFTCAICALVAWHSAGFVMEEVEYGGTAFRISEQAVPGWFLQAIIPFGFALIALRYAILFLLGLFNRRMPAQMQEPHA